MKTQEDLYLEYARVIQMTREYNAKNNADVKPWECVKLYNILLECNPEFDYKPENYTFAIAILEGKPVFVGDILYGKSSGRMVNAKQGHIWDLFTWTPPQKKRTFMLDGEELPCPHPVNITNDNVLIIQLGDLIRHFDFKESSDANTVYGFITDTLSKARDKE